MASFYDYIDSSADYLPGDVYRAQVSRYGTPMRRADALQALRMDQMDFDLDNSKGLMQGQLFGTFAALNNNPNALFAAKVGQTFPKGLMNNPIPGFNFSGSLGV